MIIIMIALLLLLAISEYPICQEGRKEGLSLVIDEEG